MAFPEDALEVRAQGWRSVALFHDLIHAVLERELQRQVSLSVTEYTVLDVLSRQVGVHHLRMQQLARATALSRSATTRLVTRLEDRGLLQRYLCVDDRRGIYTELTPAGAELLQQARPVHGAALHEALDDARTMPELSDLVKLMEANRAASPN